MCRLYIIFVSCCKEFYNRRGGGLVWRELPGVDDEEIYKNIMLMSLHGQSKDALAKTKLGAWEYDIVAPLYKCNMTDIVASIGLVQMDRYPGLLARRRQIIGMYNEGIQAPDIEYLQHYTDEYTSVDIFILFALWVKIHRQEMIL